MIDNQLQHSISCASIAFPHLRRSIVLRIVNAVWLDTVRMSMNTVLDIRAWRVHSRAQPTTSWWATRAVGEIKFDEMFMPMHAKHEHWAKFLSSENFVLWWSKMPHTSAIHRKGDQDQDNMHIIQDVHAYSNTGTSIAQRSCSCQCMHTHSRWEFLLFLDVCVDEQLNC